MRKSKLWEFESQQWLLFWEGWFKPTNTALGEVIYHTLDDIKPLKLSWKFWKVKLVLGFALPISLYS